MAGELSIAWAAGRKRSVTPAAARRRGLLSDFGRTASAGSTSARAELAATLRVKPMMWQSKCCAGDKVICLLAIMSAARMPCSSSAFSTTAPLNFAAPPTVTSLRGFSLSTSCPQAGSGLRHPGALTAARRQAAVVRPKMVAVSMVDGLEPIEDMRDYRDDDLSGRRLFVTGLPSSIDDVRLYLAFEGFGKILEAHVAKPGLGFVVFDQPGTADEALAAMEGTEISGKEIKVKRARSFYIRQEEEARLRLESAEREREQQATLIASEQARRLRAAEADAFDAAMAQNKGLGHHLRTFDVHAVRAGIAQDMQHEGLRPQARALAAGAARTHVTGGEMDSVADYVNMGRVRMRAARRGLAAKTVAASEKMSHGDGQVLVGAEAEAEMARRAGSRRRRTQPLSLDSVLAPDMEGRTLSAKDEERIRKQAMIEIMKEGDKLPKTDKANLRPEDINIAHLIRQRVEQIRRYEMLRDNKELLEQITFTTSNPTSRCVDTEDELAGEPALAGNGARAAEFVLDADADADADDIVVTETEEELIAMIGSQSRLPALGVRAGTAAPSTAARAGANGYAAGALRAGGLVNGFGDGRPAAAEGGGTAAPLGGMSKKGGGSAAAAATGAGAAGSSASVAAPAKKGRGRPRKAPGEKKAYVPTGRPRGRPRKQPESA